MHDVVLTLFGHGSDLDALQMTLRAIAVFVAIIAMIRIAGRRSVGQHRSFDVCVTVLLGSVLSRAVVGASPFWPTMCSGVAIVVLHRLVAMASVRWASFESLVDGRERELVSHGRHDPEQMRKALVTPRDLDEAVRKKTGDETTPLERAVLERDGQLTVKVAERGN